MYPGEPFWWGGWWMFPMAMPVIMVVVVLIALYFLFGRRGFRPPCWDKYPGGESALDILKKRYAKGEISKEEFERIKKDLLS